MLMILFNTRLSDVKQGDVKQSGLNHEEKAQTTAGNRLSKASNFLNFDDARAKYESGCEFG
jgi:hypothetical protein